MKNTSDGERCAVAAAAAAGGDDGKASVRPLALIG